MDMEVCRVCLSSDKEMYPFDQSFISNYNLLTNLNINLFDGMPQCCCQTCLDTIKYFVEFREKSIASETTLRTFILPEVKEEQKIQVEINEKNCNDESPVKDIKTELEIKHESDESLLDNFDINFEELLETKDEAIKPKKIKTRKKKKHKKKYDASQLLENLVEKIENRWFCGVCPNSFDDVEGLNNHLEIHENDRRCELCKEELNSYSQLLAHRLMHVPMKQNKCHICGKRYRACTYLEYHYRHIHITTDEPQLTCKYCSRKFKTPKKLVSHGREVHNENRYFCDVCSKGYRNKSNLKSHIKSHSSKKGYVCDLCGFSCKQSSGLQDHKIRKHVLDKVYCKNCRRPFPSQEKHDQHKCGSIKTIICPVCGETLNGNNRLNRHMQKHSDARIYECTRCPAKFKTRGALVVHNNRHDGNRTHQCEYCPAKFYSPSVLIKHRRIHTGEKPYVCKVCNKGFTGGHNLKVHMKVHGEYLVVKKNTEPELTIVIN